MGAPSPTASPAAPRPCDAQVDQISIPAVSGEFGVLPGHVPVIAQLKPGVLAVHLETDKNVKKARTSARPSPGASQRVAWKRAGGSGGAPRHLVSGAVQL